MFLFVWWNYINIQQSKQQLWSTFGLQPCIYKKTDAEDACFLLLKKHEFDIPVFGHFAEFNWSLHGVAFAEHDWRTQQSITCIPLKLLTWLMCAYCCEQIVKQGNCMQQPSNKLESFVNNLTYFDKITKGSYPHWSKKKGELHSWTHDHVESGKWSINVFYDSVVHGSFLARHVLANLGKNGCCWRSFKQMQVRITKVASILNNCSPVVDEHFQFRVETWLEFVGRPVLSTIGWGTSVHWEGRKFKPTCLLCRII